MTGRAFGVCCNPSSKRGTRAGDGKKVSGQGLGQVLEAETPRHGTEFEPRVRLKEASARPRWL